MKTKQWKKAAALMSAGAMTASIFAAPLAVKADDKVTISFSFDQGVGEATQKMVDAYNESQDKVEVQTVILPQDANTVHDDFVNKLAYKASSPKRGDIIVFRTNASDDAALHIRRVIGLPGETIQIVNGRILINGETYKEGKDFPTINNPGMAANAITLEAGEYFVLGDNRNNSEDSRYGDIGRVNKKYITGKLWFQISPKKDIGPLNN